MNTPLPGAVNFLSVLQSFIQWVYFRQAPSISSQFYRNCCSLLVHLYHCSFTHRFIIIVLGLLQVNIDSEKASIEAFSCEYTSAVHCQFLLSFTEFSLDLLRNCCSLLVHLYHCSFTHRFIIIVLGLLQVNIDSEKASIAAFSCEYTSAVRCQFLLSFTEFYSDFLRNCCSLLVHLYHCSFTRRFILIVLSSLQIKVDSEDANIAVFSCEYTSAVRCQFLLSFTESYLDFRRNCCSLLVHLYHCSFTHRFIIIVLGLLQVKGNSEEASIAAFSCEYTSARRRQFPLSFREFYPDFCRNCCSLLVHLYHCSFTHRFIIIVLGLLQVKVDSEEASFAVF